MRRSRIPAARACIGVATASTRATAFLAAGQVSIHDDRWLTHPWGVKGGRPGARGSKVLERADGSVEILPSKCDRVRVEVGDILHFRTWGGGGWGDPLERPADRVLYDVEGGLASIEGARRYGVVVEEGEGRCRVDQEATAALRDEMRRDRGNEPPLFDKGGSIDDLIARCRQETGLEPPRPPIVPQWAQPLPSLGK